MILAVAGEVGIVSAPVFQRKLAGIVNSGETKLILDLGDTSYISSSGLGAISQAAKDLREKGGGLCLAHVNYLNREVMDFFGLLPVVNICKDVDAAMKVFAAGSQP